MKNVRLSNIVTVKSEMADMLNTTTCKTPDADFSIHNIDECVINDRVKWLVANQGLTLLQAVEQNAREYAEWERDTREWLSNPDNFDSDIYSDVYKDYYGFRPRF